MWRLCEGRGFDIVESDRRIERIALPGFIGPKIHQTQVCGFAIVLVVLLITRFPGIIPAVEVAGRRMGLAEFVKEVWRVSGFLLPLEQITD